MSPLRVFSILRRLALLGSIGCLSAAGPDANDLAPGELLPPVLGSGAPGISPGDQMPCYLLGETDAAWTRWKEIWDGMRALDYLQSRPEIDPARLGCTGNSGGGTQTAFLLALDDRIRASAPSCYVHHYASQVRNAMGDGEQNVYGALAFGFDHPDFLLMRAPVPVKLLAATHDFFPIGATWETFRLAKRAYLGMEAEDILTAVREARRRANGGPVDLWGVGRAGPPVLHAAFAEPGAVRHVTLERSLNSWDEVVRQPRFFGQFMNLVPGALRQYDLPDLVAGLGDRVTVREPTDAFGQTERERTKTLDPADKLPSRPGLIVVRYGNPRFANPQSGDRLDEAAARWRESVIHRGRDWSARWRGFLVPDADGPLVLAFDTNQQTAVRVNGRDLVQAGRAGARLPVAVEARAGAPLAFEVDFVKPGTKASAEEDVCTLRLLRAGADGEWRPLPAPWLRHSREQELQIEELLR